MFLLSQFKECTNCGNIITIIISMILFLKIVKKSFAYNTLIIGISNGMVAVLLVLIVAGYTAYTHPQLRIGL